MGDGLVTGEERRRLRMGVGEILGQHHPEGRAALTPAVWRAIDEALRLMPSGRDDRPGSVSGADVWRVRVAKLLARLLPPEQYGDRGLRGRLRAEIRTEVVAVLGPEAWSPSPYLDPDPAGPS